MQSEEHDKCELSKRQIGRRFEEYSMTFAKSNDIFLDGIGNCHAMRILYDNRKRSVQCLIIKNIQKTFTESKFFQRNYGDCWPLFALSIVLECNHIISAEVYFQQHDEMHNQLMKMLSVLVNRRVPMLFDDNIRPHIARMILPKPNHLG